MDAKAAETPVFSILHFLVVGREYRNILHRSYIGSYMDAILLLPTNHE